MDPTVDEDAAIELLELLTKGAGILAGFCSLENPIEREVARHFRKFTGIDVECLDNLLSHDAKDEEYHMVFYLFWRNTRNVSV